MAFPTYTLGGEQKMMICFTGRGTSPFLYTYRYFFILNRGLFFTFCVSVCISISVHTKYLKSCLSNQLHFWWTLFRANTNIIGIDLESNVTGP